MNYTPWHKADIYLGKPTFKIIAPLSSDLRSHFTYLKPFFSQVEFYVCPVFCDRLRLSLFLYEDKIKAKVWPRIDLAEIMGPMDSASRLVIGRYVAQFEEEKAGEVLFWKHIFDIFSLERLFQWWGRLVTRRPYPVILACLYFFLTILYFLFYFLFFRLFWRASSSLLSPPSDSSISGLINANNCPTCASAMWCWWSNFFIPLSFSTVWCMDLYSSWMAALFAKTHRLGIGEVPIHGSADFKLKDLAVTWICASIRSSVA